MGSLSCGCNFFISFLNVNISMCCISFTLNYYRLFIMVMMTLGGVKFVVLVCLNIMLVFMIVLMLMLMIVMLVIVLVMLMIMVVMVSMTIDMCMTFSMLNMLLSLNYSNSLFMIVMFMCSF